jgi:hypothetical protein
MRGTPSDGSAVAKRSDVLWLVFPDENMPGAGLKAANGYS